MKSYLKENQGVSSRISSESRNRETDPIWKRSDIHRNRRNAGVWGGAPCAGWERECVCVCGLWGVSMSGLPRIPELVPDGGKPSWKQTGNARQQLLQVLKTVIFRQQLMEECRTQSRAEVLIRSLSEPAPSFIFFLLIKDGLFFAGFRLQLCSFRLC